MKMDIQFRKIAKKVTKYHELLVNLLNNKKGKLGIHT